MATSADIQSYKRNRDGIVEYSLKVVHNGREWVVKKRYSEFAQLHDYLLKDVHYTFTNQPHPLKGKFPPKKIIWKKNDKKILTKRLNDLKQYLQEVMIHYSVNENSLIKEFLEIETFFLRFAKQNSTAEAIRLDKIPMIFSDAMIHIPTIRRKSSSISQHLQSSSSSATSQFLAPGGYSLKKTKSFSFSSRTPPPSLSIRKDSISQYDIPPTPGRDRRFSIDIFNRSSMYSTEVSTLQAAVKKSAFVKSTEALWDHYSNEIYDLEDKEMDLEVQLMERTQAAIVAGSLKIAVSSSSTANASNGNSNNNNNHHGNHSLREMRSSFQLVLRELSFRPTSDAIQQHIYAIDQLQLDYYKATRLSPVPLPVELSPIIIDHKSNWRSPSTASVQPHHNILLLEDILEPSSEVFPIDEVLIKEFQQLNLLKGKNESAGLIPPPMITPPRIALPPISPATSDESLSQKNV